MTVPLGSSVEDVRAAGHGPGAGGVHDAVHGAHRGLPPLPRPVPALPCPLPQQHGIAGVLSKSTLITVSLYISWLISGE